MKNEKKTLAEVRKDLASNISITNIKKKEPKTGKKNIALSSYFDSCENEHFDFKHRTLLDADVNDALLLIKDHYNKPIKHIANIILKDFILTHKKDIIALQRENKLL